MSNKFGAVKTRLDGHTFDSKREAAVYAQLKLLAQASEINALEVHPLLPLHTTGNDGIKRKIGVHRVDFSYWCCERKERRYVEIKGVDHREGKWRRKYAEAEYGIVIEVRK